VAPVAGVEGLDVDLVALSKKSPSPLGRTGGWNYRFNLDGLVTFSGPSSGPQHCFTQVFRNGALEGVVALRLVTPPNDRTGPEMSALGLERTAADGASDYMAIVRSWGFEGPVAVMISLLNVQGASLGMEPDHRMIRYTVDRRYLILPDIVVEDRSDLLAALRPAFDALWQSAGWERSFGYRADGTWDPARH